MTDNEFYTWQKTRIEGQTQFILKHGLLIYGLFLAFSFVGGKVLYYFVANKFGFSFVNINFIGENAFLFIFFLFFGIVLAWQVWVRKEKEFLNKEIEFDV